MIELEDSRFGAQGKGEVALVDCEKTELREVSWKKGVEVDKYWPIFFELPCASGNTYLWMPVSHECKHTSLQGT